MLTTLEAKERRKRTLNGELADLNGMAQVSRLDGKRLANDLRLRVGDTRALLSRHVPQACQMLRRLLDDHLVWEPYNEEGQRAYGSRRRVAMAPCWPLRQGVMQGQNPCPPPP